MDSPIANQGFWRFSLAELLIAIGFVAISCAALKYAGEVWATCLSVGVILLFMGAAVTAVVDRGPLQARAIGLTLFMGIYGVLFWSCPTHANYEQSTELDPYTGRLPTSKLLKPLFETLVSRNYLDGSGKKVGPPTPGIGFGGIGGISMSESPDRGQFMAIGHLLCALLLGYLGSRVALWAYARRHRSQPT